MLMADNVCISLTVMRGLAFFYQCPGISILGALAIREGKSFRTIPVEGDVFCLRYDAIFLTPFCQSLSAFLGFSRHFCEEYINRIYLLVSALQISIVLFRPFFGVGENGGQVWIVRSLIQ